jgi:hypothetical protein
MTSPPYRVMDIPPTFVDYANGIAKQRHAREGDGGKLSRPLDSGANGLRGDQVGALAEVAVCLFYGREPEAFVLARHALPGPQPDLLYETSRRTYRVSVKGRERWIEPLDLVVPSYDVENDVYILVSVNLAAAQCALRGWIKRERLLTYPPQAWQWTDDRPGAERDALRRYVPLADLRPCRQPTTRPP